MKEAREMKSWNDLADEPWRVVQKYVWPSEKWARIFEKYGIKTTANQISAYILLMNSQAEKETDMKAIFRK